MYSTCNCYDHVPHLEKIWTHITAEFHKIMNDLMVMLTGKGADGDSRERTMFLQSMYSRWRHKHHPRRSVFSAPIPATTCWLWLQGQFTFKFYSCVKFTITQSCIMPVRRCKRIPIANRTRPVDWQGPVLSCPRSHPLQQEILL